MIHKLARSVIVRENSKQTAMCTIFVDSCKDTFKLSRLQPVAAYFRSKPYCEVIYTTSLSRIDPTITMSSNRPNTRSQMASFPWKKREGDTARRYSVEAK